MIVKIKNDYLPGASKLLFNLSLKGKQSRHRTKLIKLMEDRWKEVAEQEKALLKEHCHLDENGEPKKKEDGQHYDVKDAEAFKKDQKELFEEELVLEGGDAQGMLKTVKTVLLDCDVEW
ncbi:hypothetical protein, partial [Alkalihalophilus marmarensis]|uniref:hypothetical protein n=1 Tax=Alkalihalophilus marmarensis TaxID=521377 RepID=UPI002E211A73|nr:hypothetical protein [Alkalihalophilus marmarensis]